jgi:transcriptional regulator with XRE-family HTH domain
LANRLRSLRGGLTQTEAALRCGINSGTWQNLERAVGRPQPATVRRIAQGFSEPFDALWAYVEDTPLEERFTDEELDRLARRLAPMIAQYLQRD